MNKPAILAAAAGLAVGAMAFPVTSAMAQRNPLEDFLSRIGRDSPNQALGCNVVKRINRGGDIVYLQMTCRAYGRR